MVNVNMSPVDYGCSLLLACTVWGAGQLLTSSAGKPIAEKRKHNKQSVLVLASTMSALPQTLQQCFQVAHLPECYAPVETHIPRQGLGWQFVP